MKIHPVGGELLQADGWMDGRTDRDNDANSRMSRFCGSA